MTVYCGVCGPCIEVPGIADAAFGPVRQAGRLDVPPRLARVAREIDQACIAAGPDHVAIERRRSHCVDHSVAARFCAADVCRTRLWRVRRCAGEIGTNLLPTHAAIGGAQEVLRPEVDSVRVT